MDKDNEKRVNEDVKRAFLLAVKILSSITFILFSNCFPQKQNPSFEMLTIPVGKGAASVEAADLNNDNLPDLAVANSEDSSVTILLNAGKRKFIPAAGSPFYAGHAPMIFLLKISIKTVISI